MSTETARDMIKEHVVKSDFDSVVKFDCGDDGVLLIDKQSVSCEDGDAQCTIGVTLADLIAMFKGELNPTMGFMQGKLKIDGDMSVAMRLSSLLP